MQSRQNPIRFIAAVSIAVGGLCYGSFAIAGESTMGAPNPVDWSGHRVPLSGADPGRIGSMAGVGARPSKAEQEKMAAAKAGSKTATTTASLNLQDRSFILEAARRGLMEVQMGQAAAKHGQTAEVKKLGARIASDRAQTTRQLMGIALGKGLKVDTNQETITMSSAGFDQEWLARMEKNQQNEIALFDKAAKNGTDPDAKAWAARTLSTLTAHQKMVQGAQQKMAKAD